MSSRRSMRLLGFVCLLGFAVNTAAAEITVSAAASLTNAFKDIGQAYEAKYPGGKVLFNFGASGALLQQIAKGAPVDIFASADQETMGQAQQQGLIQEKSRVNFVHNSLVMIVPADSKLNLKSLNDLAQAGVQRIAIGNPASVPVGRYTRQALEAAKLWPMAQEKMISATNVRQALDYVARGEVEAGFVYATDAALVKDKVRVAFAVPLDKVISYPLALTQNNAKTSAHAEEAQRFVSYIHSAEAQAILGKYGFLKP